VDGEEYVDKLVVHCFSMTALNTPGKNGEIAVIQSAIVYSFYQSLLGRSDIDE
jgi:hypothetical protein